MGTAIEVGMGVAFVFALVSLMCTGVQEMLSAALNLRGKTLWEGVQSLLQANAPARTGQPAQSPARGDTPGLRLEDEMRRHPLITALIPDRFGPRGFVQWLLGTRRPTTDLGSARPSYLQASTFATVLADAIGTVWKGGQRRFDDFGQAVAAMPDCELKQVLQGMLRETRGDAVKLRAMVEAWYDETMVRVTGWYKRRTQVLLLLVGLVLAGVMNIDTIRIANALATDPALRKEAATKAVAAAASQGSQATPPRDGASAARAAFDDLQALNLPIGWSAPNRPRDLWQGVLMLLGWLITAAAATFGAPFWFDLINKFVPLRAAGARPPALPEPPLTGGTAPSRAPLDGVRGAPPRAEPFRAAMNEFEATGLDASDLLQVKRMLGLDGPTASTPVLDQVTRDAIRRKQEAMGWPATGELSARWIEHFRTGAA